MRKFTYDMEINQVLGIDIYYKPKFWKFLFDQALNSDKSRAVICTVLVDRCPDINALNGNLTVTECVHQLAMLPAYSAEANFDGYDYGCRVFHSYIASFNPLHCPHISFEPVQDVNGLVKCQTSKNKTADEYFDQDDIALFDAFILSEEDSLVGTIDGYRVISWDETAAPTSGPPTTASPSSPTTQAPNLLATESPSSSARFVLKSMHHCHYGWALMVATLWWTMRGPQTL